MQQLVTTAWLAENSASSNLVIFDATKYLPNEPKDGLLEFRRAHVPGARYFDIDAIADADTDLPHMVPTPGRFAKLIGALGVSNDSIVVFSADQKGLASCGARLVDDGAVRSRQRRRAGWRLAEMAGGRPQIRNRRSGAGHRQEIHPRLSPRPPAWCRRRAG